MEWLTGAVLAIDSATLHRFIYDQKFDTAKDLSQVNISGNGYLKNFPAAFNTAENIYLLNRRVGDKTVKYVADLNRQLLWAEINYADWSGN
ncbi:hypothetical protein [Flavihumibacter petaseus]|nr:hypothetical protein [Flavihumibacter petaseus]